MINTRVFPWIKIIIKIFNNINLKSDYQIKSSKNLFKALLNMYQLQTHLNLNKNRQVKKKVLIKKKILYLLVFNLFIW